MGEAVGEIPLGFHTQGWKEPGPLSAAEVVAEKRKGKRKTCWHGGTLREKAYWDGLRDLHGLPISGRRLGSDVGACEGVCATLKHSMPFSCVMF